MKNTLRERILTALADGPMVLPKLSRRLALKPSQNAELQRELTLLNREKVLRILPGNAGWALTSNPPPQVGHIQPPVGDMPADAPVEHIEFPKPSPEVVARAKERIAESRNGRTGNPNIRTIRTKEFLDRARERKRAAMELFSDGRQRNTAQVAEKLGVTLKMASNTLLRLERRGQLRRVAMGIYALPEGVQTVKYRDIRDALVKCADLVMDGSLSAPEALAVIEIYNRIAAIDQAGG